MAINTKTRNNVTNEVLLRPSLLEKLSLFNTDASLLAPNVLDHELLGIHLLF